MRHGGPGVNLSIQDPVSPFDEASEIGISCQVYENRNNSASVIGCSRKRLALWMMRDVRRRNHAGRLVRRFRPFEEADGIVEYIMLQ